MESVEQKRWLMLIGEYTGVEKSAVNMLSGWIAGQISRELVVKYAFELTEEESKANNIVAVGRFETNGVLAAYEKAGLLSVPNEEQGYSVYVGKKPNDDGQTIAIAGADEKGVLYGCMQFMSEYCGDVLYKQGYLFGENFFEKPLERELPEWRVSTYPAIKTRALWTWGHVIYDYRAFFDNMARLRLNEIVIWNDYVPFNAQEVVDYAHGLGIKVIWGFAWGWTNNLMQTVEETCSEAGLKQVKEKVLTTYEEQYAKTGGDGIYFQSFTELNTDSVNGKCIAEIVTELVNDIVGELLSRYPNLHIQFGLHATSVRTHLDILKKVDKRIHIIWEDCGAFPYNYLTDRIENFAETYAFTEELLCLRGEEEKFGTVLKGMLNLDWNTFHHHTGRYILGERSKAFIQERQVKKDKIWKIVQGGWLKNAKYLQKTVELMSEKGKEAVVQALVEDGMFENRIAMPVVIYAQTLWSPTLTVEEIIEKASKSPFVDNV